MAGRSPETLEFSPKAHRGRAVTAAAEARELVADIAGPLRLGENVKAALARVARATGIGMRRIRGIWNGEARSILSDEMDRLRTAALRAKADEARRAAAHADHTDLLALLDAYETALRVHGAHGARALDHAPR